MTEFLSLQDVRLRQSNQLVEARYRLSVGEQRLIFLMLSNIHPEDTDLRTYKIHISDFKRVLGLRDDGVYIGIIQIVKTLMTKTFFIPKDKSYSGNDLQIGWISSVEYLKGQEMVELSFDPKLKPYLLDLKREFTTLKLQHVMKIAGAYTIKLYLLLKYYLIVSGKRFKLDELKQILEIPENEYKLFGHFKSMVLNPAKEEINKKTDILFDFKTVKTGRRVTAIDFAIWGQKPQEVLPFSDVDAMPDLIEKLSPEKEKAMVD